MKTNEFYVGARVICTKPFAGFDWLVGKIGTVVVTLSNVYFDIGVEFDEPFTGGHTCSGACRDGYGRFGAASSLELFQEIPPELTMSYDEVMGW